MDENLIFVYEYSVNETVESAERKIKSLYENQIKIVGDFNFPKKGVTRYKVF